MSTRLAPSTLLSSANFSSCLISYINDDPSAPDANFCVASAQNVATSLTVEFTSPGTVSGAQDIAWYVRKNGGTGTPTTNIELHQNGVLIRAGTPQNVTSTAGQLFTFSWDSSELPDPTANVQIAVVNTYAAGISSVRAAVDVGAVAWDYQIFTGTAYQLAQTETFSFAESMAKGIVVTIPEAVAFAESIDKQVSFVREITEYLNFSEAKENNLDKQIVEALAFVENLKKQIDLDKTEQLTIAETDLVSLGKTLSLFETIGFAESIGREYGLNIVEALTLVDAWRRSADMVISDMIIAQSDMTMDDFVNFMQFGNPAGFEKWRNFVPGDYEYAEAMVRAIINSSTTDRGLLSGLEMSVDVPDLIDTGTATVTDPNAGIYIAYARLFHVVPEITIAAKGGDTNPTVAEFYGSPTKTGFTVRLRDTITNTFVTGSLTWAAHGY